LRDSYYLSFPLKTREFEERVRQERDRARELEEKMEDNKVNKSNKEK